MRKPKTARKKKLSRKQKILVSALAAGSDRVTAEQLAGYSTKHPGQSAYQALKYLANSFPELLDKHGLTDSVLIEKHLKPLLKATRTKHWAHDGKVKSARTYKDNDTRLAALDMTFRLKGSFAPLKTGTENKSVDVIVVDLPRPIHLPENGENSVNNSRTIAVENTSKENK
jgi:hypothetical protein